MCFLPWLRDGIAQPADSPFNPPFEESLLIHLLLWFNTASKKVVWHTTPNRQKRTREREILIRETERAGSLSVYKTRLNMFKGENTILIETIPSSLLRTGRKRSDCICKAPLLKREPKHPRFHPSLELRCSPRTIYTRSTASVLRRCVSSSVMAR